MSVRGVYTAAEDAVILAHYRTQPVVAIAAMLPGRSLGSVYVHVRKLRRAGQIPIAERAYRKPWTEAERQTLRGLWGWITLGEISAQLGRTPEAVKDKAAVMHLGRQTRRRLLSATAVADIFGVDSHLVVFWVRQGWLKGCQTSKRTGKGRFWLILSEDVEAFIRAWPPHYDRHRIQARSWYRILADRVAKAQVWLTARQAARRLGVHVGTVHQHCQHGWLPAIKTTGASNQGDWRIAEAHLTCFQPRRAIGGKGGRGRPGMRTKQKEMAA